MKTAYWGLLLVTVACVWYLSRFPSWEFQGDAIIVAGNCSDCYQDPRLIRFLNTTDIPVVRFNNNRRFFSAKHTINIANGLTAYTNVHPDVIVTPVVGLPLLILKTTLRPTRLPSLVIRERYRDTTGWTTIRHLLQRTPSPPTIYIVGFRPLSGSTTGKMDTRNHDFKKECMMLEELVAKGAVVPLHAPLECGK